MSAFKLILSDIREGILRNKRYILVPILCLFECMSADINLNMFKVYGGIKSPTTFLDLIAELFHGCDPITKAPDPSTVIALPYFWIALFVERHAMSKKGPETKKAEKSRENIKKAQFYVEFHAKPGDKLQKGAWRYFRRKSP